MSEEEQQTAGSILDSPEWAEACRLFEEGMSLVEKKSEDYWNSLTKEQQLDAFCAVIRRIYLGDCLQRRSYRGVLYGVFGFGPEAYAAAQRAGYLSIHNDLFEPNGDYDTLKAFCLLHGLDPQSHIQSFYNMTKDEELQLRLLLEKEYESRTRSTET